MADPAADIHERAARTAQVLLAAAHDASFWVSPDNRIGIDDCAKLLGMTPRGFKRRLEGSALLVYQLGGGRHKQSIRIFDLAMWMESQAVTGALAA